MPGGLNLVRFHPTYPVIRYADSFNLSFILPPYSVLVAYVRLPTEAQVALGVAIRALIPGPTSIGFALVSLIGRTICNRT